LKKDISHNTRIKRQTLYNNLKEFQEHEQFTITYERVNLDFFELYIDYFADVKNNVNATLQRNIGLVKSFCASTKKKKYHTNPEFAEFEFKFSTNRTVITLTKEERNRIYEYDFSDNIRLEQARDVFILGCYTGMRYSDLNNLKPENIVNDCIEFVSYKTTKPQIIPLTEVSRLIVNKYKSRNGFLPVISNQKLNDYIKEACEIIGIDTPTQRVKFKRKLRLQQTLPKYEFISSHTARRTFGTLYLNDGGSIHILKDIYAHSKIETTLQYIGWTRNDIKEDMRKVFSLETPKIENPMFDVARKLLVLNTDVNVIVQATGLSEAEIQKL